MFRLTLLGAAVLTLVCLGTAAWAGPCTNEFIGTGYDQKDVAKWCKMYKDAKTNVKLCKEAFNTVKQTVDRRCDLRSGMCVSWQFDNPDDKRECFEKQKRDCAMGKQWNQDKYDFCIIPLSGGM